MPRPKVHWIRGRSSRALGSIVRFELLQAVLARQPATVEALGEELGRDPKSIYPHLKALIDAGLVRQGGELATGRRPAALYEPVAERLEFDPQDRSPATLAAREKFGRAVLRRATEHHRAALHDPDVVASGPAREFLLACRSARLKPGARRRVNAKIRELLELLGEEHDPQGGKPVTLTLQLSPRPRAAGD